MNNSPAVRRRGRRRPRGYPLSRRDDGFDFQKHATDFAGGASGPSDGGRTVEIVPIVGESSALGGREVAGPPNDGCGGGGGGNNDADDNDQIGEIDAVLERRQREGLPAPRGTDACVGHEDFRLSGSSESSDLSEGTNDESDESKAADKAKILGRGVAVVKIPMTDDDLAAAHEDVLGRPLPGRARMQRHLTALEMEVTKLPPNQCHALEKALDMDPLLFENLPHAKLLLLDDDDDGTFDAAAAALRLAQYWEARRSLLGDDLCYGHLGAMSAGAGKANGLGSDFQRYFKRTRDVLNDPSAEKMLREDAAMVMQCIEERNLEALNTVMRRMEEKELAEKINDIKRMGRGQLCPKEDGDLPSVRRMARKTSSELKLQFLRVEDMAIVRAATRLVQYCETGLCLFGPGFSPSERVTLENDMCEGCSALLDSQVLRLMPEEDDFGRSIICFVTPQSNYLREKNLTAGGDGLHFARVLWYIIHAALERDSCKRNGIVYVFESRVYPTNTKVYRKNRDTMVNVINCVPVKIRAIHMWFDQDSSWLQRTVFRGFSFIADVWLRRRVILHTGTVEQLLAELGYSYGIGAEKLPKELGGAVDANYFLCWLKERSGAGL